MSQILIVDDEPDTVDMIKSILEMYGFSVNTAHNGKECLKKVNKNNTELVLLDIMMPDMSGWEVFNKIRKTKKNLKVIFISVVEISPERKQSLIKDGLFDYINKPFTKDDLVGRVKNAIETV
ncbi:MAG: response regulator [Candidatus Aenigmarchaeota archaeon]|nr:response regulator [Candidatus Aenigmarchaeota archaeon]